MAWTQWADWDGTKTEPVLTLEYKDAGDWARHYSTVRMTVGTFFVSAATGMIYLRWDHPQIVMGVFAAGVFSIGAILFWIYSKLTFQKINRQLAIADSYRTVLGKTGITESKRFWRVNGLLLGIGIALFVLLDGWWIYQGQRNPGQTIEIKVPISIKVGNEPPAALQVPLKVTVP